MSYRTTHSENRLLEAARIAEAFLRKRGEIDLATIESLPFIQSEEETQIVLGHLRSRLPISVARKVDDTSPILRWDTVVRLEQCPSHQPKAKQLSGASHFIP